MNYYYLIMDKLYYASSLHYLVNMGFSNEIIYDYLQNNDTENINDTNSLGETALHYAIRNKNDRLIKLLLDKKADLYQFDESGNTPYSLIMKAYDVNNYMLFHTIKTYTRAYRKWQKIKTYIIATSVLKQVYKQTVNKMWMPGGKEYLKSKQNFYNLVYSN